MTRLHLIDTGFALADALASRLERRRVPFTRGEAAAGQAAQVLVAAASDSAAEQAILAQARGLQVRQVVLVREGATRLAVESELGGRVTRVALPDVQETDPALLLLADLLAAPLCPMVAADPVTGALIDLAHRVARSDVTLFINGPTGSGKEIMARTVHAASPRADKPFIALNCAAIPENMLEAILFGHEKGAFTGAACANRGLIRAAEGGSLMLDEISEMPLGLQAKLLRVLQERQVMPLGASAEVPVDIRVIATSNRDMRAEVQAGRFREDLLYRLNVFPLATRALKQRPEDIPALAVALLRRHATCATPPLFTPAAMAALLAHDWPGNVRELENVVQRALVLCDGDRITAADIMLDAGNDLLLAAGIALALAS